MNQLDWRLAAAVWVLTTISAGAQPQGTRVFLNKVIHQKSAQGRHLWIYHFDIQGPIELPTRGYSWSLVDFPGVESEVQIGIVDPSNWSKSLSGNRITFTYTGTAASWIDGAWLPRPAVNSAFKVETRTRVPTPIRWESGSETGFAIVDERSLDHPLSRGVWGVGGAAGLLVVLAAILLLLRRSRSVAPPPEAAA